MRLFILILSLLSIHVNSFSQKNQHFPYSDGEQCLKDDFLKYLSPFYKANDSVYNLTILIQYDSLKRSIEVDMIGTNDKLTNRIKDFFIKSKGKWDTSFLKRSRVILPVSILFSLIYENGSFKESNPILIQNNDDRIESGHAFYISPWKINMAWYQGVCGDPLEIPGSWGKEHNIIQNKVPKIEFKNFKKVKYKSRFE
jgi:hypothetical protein